jgi:pimeloyl-ACP methyl ester carboxylesterase
MVGPGARLRRLGAGAIAAIALASLPSGAAAGGTTLVTGFTTEASGLKAQYKIEVPASWNGTLVLYSHGYNSFTVPLPPDDAGDPATGAWLLSQGYAIAGSAYARAGWSVENAFQDQIALLDVFAAKFERPKRTIAWGHSLGGMITAGLVQNFPGRFTAALPMCGVVAGGIGVWNQGLDSEFALLALQFPGAFKLVNFTSASDTLSNFVAASTALAGAQATPQGRARIALSAALADVPGWFDPASAQPAATDYAAQELNQFNWDNNPDFAFGFFGRAELEARAGGNFSWNTGVDYRAQLAKSVDRAEVEALYKVAGLDLGKDLAKLNDTPRISADENAVKYVDKFISYNGDLDMPVLTMHTTGDGLVEVTDEQAYASVVRKAGDSSLLRQVFVHRAGHCTFTPAETISAFKTLIDRVNTGHWPSISPAKMNGTATELGSDLNTAPASFIEFKPAQFLRPWSARTTDIGDETGNHQN